MMSIDAVSWQRIARFSSGPAMIALAISCVHWLRLGSFDATDLVPVAGIALTAIVIGSIFELRRVRQNK